MNIVLIGAIVKEHMSINFPTSLDAFNNPTETSTMDSPGVKHLDQHVNANDAIKSLESKIGVDYSSNASSLDFTTKALMMTNLGTVFNGAYREVVYNPTNAILAVSASWYTDPEKTIKLADETYTYGDIAVLPIQIVYRLFDGTVANTLKRTITDTVLYSGVFEISRIRIIT